MAINIFGFTIARQSSEEPGANDVVAPDSYDGSYTLDSGSVYLEFIKSLIEFLIFSTSTQTHIQFLEDGMSIVNYSTTLWLMRKILNWESKNFVELILFKLKKLEK